MIEALRTQDVAGIMPGGDETGIAIRSDGRRVGTCFGANSQAVGYVWGCNVGPGEQRKGVGGRLLLAIASELDAPVLVAHVLSASSGAQAFYRAFGFDRKGGSRYEIAPGHDVAVCVMASPTAGLRA
ncbi:MAG: GNAT family N-acetyltransferase [Pseudomonadota bacterium]